MITLPPEFTATKYPGYFWNTRTQSLFSIKVTGVLRPIKKCRPNIFNDYFKGYRVSHQGQRVLLKMEYLTALTPKNSIIPVQK